ncbi:MAG: DUF1007 family protein [Campylobacterota bacterium]|nr:DUF1007 family protein [Campylobacterota bacterium]
MKKVIFLFLFLAFNTPLFSCATCQLMIPTAGVSINVDMNDTKLQKLALEWKFSDAYTKELMIQYDKNKNKKLDKEELNTILEAMLKYLKPKEMLTQISYFKEDANATNLKPQYKNFTLVVKNEHLNFRYDALLNQNIEADSSLSFNFADDEKFFSFAIVNMKIHGTQLIYTQNIYLFAAFILFNDTESKAPAKIQNEEDTLSQDQLVKSQEPTLQENILQKSIAKIKSLFESVKEEKNTLSFMLLLFFAYIYGLVHALGPGHGKTLVASYFFSNERSYSKALFVSLAIGVVHTFSAFILTLIIYFFVNTFLASFLDDTVYYTTKISALIIISIALYLFYTKYRAYRQLKLASKKPEFNFSTTPHISSCACNSCKVENNSTDVALVISAGIIPCPGTTTIFIFALSLGLYYVGFLSAFVMSLGMSTIIFISALLSVTLRKKSSNSNSKLKKYFEYASLFIIFGLGVTLLLS